jgi:FKBP-type peptidyl-prolyl cis-trans isomerase
VYGLYQYWFIFYGKVLVKKAMKKLITIGLVLLLVSGGVAYSWFEKKQTSTKMEKNIEIVALASGLKYKILIPGDGAAAAKGNHVDVHYSGWLDVAGEPGKLFDSSKGPQRGEPFSFVLGAGYVIRGWDEGVAGMKVGETRRLYIPSTLGYGARGAGRDIPPHAALIFDVELIAIK